MQMQIAWERERAQNAHQWEIMDLHAAGLNPILSAGGQGAQTSGVSGAMPDVSGYAKAGEMIGSAIRIGNETQMTQSTKELNSAQSTKENAIAANEIAKNPYVQEKEKAEIANINADAAGKNLENKFQKETYNDRITQKFAQVEKDVAEGRISIDNSKFLMEYGITREVLS